VAEELEKARIRREEIILSARTEAERIRKEKEKRIDEELEAELSVAKKAMNEEKEKALKKGEKEISKLKKVAKKNKDKAIPQILDLFKENFNA